MNWAREAANRLPIGEDTRWHAAYDMLAHGIDEMERMERERSMSLHIEIEEIENGVLLTVGWSICIGGPPKPRHYATIGEAAADLERIVTEALKPETLDEAVGQVRQQRPELFHETRPERMMEEAAQADPAFIRDRPVMDTSAFERRPAGEGSEVDTSDGLAEK